MKRILICMLTLMLFGCSEGLMNLKRLNDSQTRGARCIAKKEKLFAKLKEDILQNRLKKGMAKPEAILSYGEPILAKEVSDKPGIKEFLLFRHPSRYFSTDLIYLYFDEAGMLDSWEIKEPAP